MLEVDDGLEEHRLRVELVLEVRRVERVDVTERLRVDVFMKYAHDASNSDSRQSAESCGIGFSKYLIDVSNCCVE